MNKKTIQQKVAQEILQEPSTIILDGKEYSIPLPTYGTLCAISAIISEVPESEEVTSETTVSDLLNRAKDENYAPKVLATLILGSRRLNEIHVSKEKIKWLKWHKNRQERQIKEIDYLTDIFTHDVRISEVVMAVVKILNEKMDLSFFSSVGGFLKGVQMTKPTNEINQTVLSH